MKKFLYIVIGVLSLAVIGMALFVTVIKYPFIITYIETTKAKQENSDKEGFVKYVVGPLTANGKNIKTVRILIGRVEEKDCNTVWILGEVEEKTEQHGRGTFLEVKVKPGLFTTIKGCSSGFFAKRKVFAEIKDEKLTRSNLGTQSLVIYVSGNAEVRYEVIED